MVRRFRLIDGEFRRLAPLYPNTIVIDRDSKEFHERAGLVSIIAMAGLPMFEEIPYRATVTPPAAADAAEPLLSVSSGCPGTRTCTTCTYGRVNSRISAAFESADGNTGRAGTQSVPSDQPLPQPHDQSERPRGPSAVRPQGIQRAREGLPEQSPERESFDKDAARIQEYLENEQRRRGPGPGDLRVQLAPICSKPSRSKRRSASTRCSSARCRICIRSPSSSRTTRAMRP